MSRAGFVALVMAATVAVAGTGTGWSQVGFTITPVLKGAVSEFGPQFEFSASTDEISVLLVEIAPGGTTGRLMHPVPVVGYVLQGSAVEVREDGREVVHHPGTAHFDPINTWLTVYNRGTVPAKVLLFVMGTKGKPSTVR